MSHFVQVGLGLGSLLAFGRRSLFRRRFFDGRAIFTHCDKTLPGRNRCLGFIGICDWRQVEHACGCLITGVVLYWRAIGILHVQSICCTIKPAELIITKFSCIIDDIVLAFDVFICDLQV